MQDRDTQFMRHALQLAKRGWGRVAPNPMVGAVVVRGDEVVGEGFHREWGGPHAEVEALRVAGERARGGTLYVTLEPCHHSGKTGPCSQAIRDAGISRVVYGVGEANPDAKGGGAWLQGQGISVEQGPCEVEAADLNAVHLSGHQKGRPFLALKYAMSLDGRLAEAPGRSTRLTHGDAIVEAHRLRAGHDAVMVGIGTVLADDPLLTVREWDAPRVPPRRVVLDSALRTPLDSRLVASASEVPVFILGAEDAPEERARPLEDAGVQVGRVPRLHSGGLDLGAVLANLWESSVRSVLCEGGGELGSAWLSAGHVDRIYAFVAPILLGEPGVPAFQLRHGEVAREWRTISRSGLGPVTLLVLAPEEPAA
ncbi:MAG: bifunctional diaminohydroxyphosphoribosylaminopyrimidine deaminase/5-amino-6-(5-phosphoribosylamino)uracil reductase RibD [Gemmatimonadota bacterium]|nr:MAG: bifunctional diaminohydroxyphosphoribosylaminopyrimidine deaminase/5-amino-6-(5-phosphoribosylamino)uracil reductase RibD [Gemmatimonadota bacterium]